MNAYIIANALTDGGCLPPSRHLSTNIFGGSQTACSSPRGTWNARFVKLPYDLSYSLAPLLPCSLFFQQLLHFCLQPRGDRSFAHVRTEMNRVAYAHLDGS